MAGIDVEDLKNLDSVEKLTGIFTRRLNYQYEASPISTRHWKEDIVNSILNNDIKLLAEHQDFHIIYCRIENLLLGIERPIVNQLLKEHPYLLVVFSDKSVKNWHFVNIKYDEEVKNRRLFRRIVIGPDERLHTAAQRISILEVIDEKISPLGLQNRHDSAFDVEAVTKEFFSTFSDMFHLLKENIEKNNPNYKELADEQSQLILNRRIFLYFIQKKGWLNNDMHYLYKKFRERYENDTTGKRFYTNFLVELFRALSCKTYRPEWIGDAPFLNGGLFEIDPFHSKLPF